MGGQGLLREWNYWQLLKHARNKDREKKYDKLCDWFHDFNQVKYHSFVVEILLVCWVDEPFTKWTWWKQVVINWVIVGIWEWLGVFNIGWIPGYQGD